MNLDACIEFAHAIDLQRMTIDRASGWINASCPMVWHHKHGDTHPSFGIKADPDGPSFWNCFTYGYGTLPRLLHTLQFGLGIMYLEASDILTSNEIIKTRDDPNWREYHDIYATSGVIDEESDVAPIPEEVLQSFPSVMTRSAEAKLMREYLMGERGISLAMLQKYDIRYSSSLNAVIFPVRDRGGNLVYMRARCRGTKIIFEISPVHTKYPELVFPGKRRSGALFGMHLIDYSKPVMVVESELEAMKLATMGLTNVVASCAGIAQSQLRALSYPIILIGYDVDAAGDRSKDKVI